MVSSSDRKLASAVGAKTARACDSCIRKRARWYCAADDAFLCQTCDYSVHSANPLARRHKRVRLKSSSSLKTPINDFLNLESLARSWPHGFTRKARTPRHRKHAKPSDDNPDRSGPTVRHPLHLVPEMFSDENSHDENDEQLLYRVPIFDPLVAEMCSSGLSMDNNPDAQTNIHHQGSQYNLNKSHGIIPSDIELAEFDVDVESLLGKGLDDVSFDMEGIGLFGNFNRVKLESEIEDGDNVEDVAIANNNVVGLKLGDECNDYSPIGMCDEEEHDENRRGFGMIFQQSDDYYCSQNNDEKKKISLKLDYDGVIKAWDDERSPWTNGERPDLDSNDCWPDLMDVGSIHPYGEMGGMSMVHAATVDEGREARVTRYREKRQKRLFSKKIRYEVRKLNAEKRPRMKGRFVKRANFVTNPLPFPLLTK